MRFRWLTILLIALLTIAFLLLNIYGLFELIEIFKNRQIEKVHEFQNKHRVASENKGDVITTTTTRTTHNFKTIPETTTRIEVVRPVDVSTVTTRRPSWVWSSTPVPEGTTAARIRTWTNYPSPTHHPIHHDDTFRENGRFQLHYETTKEPPRESATRPVTTTDTTSRIRVTTPVYIRQTQSTELPYERISIPASSSYRNPYIHKIAVITSTNRAVDSTTRNHHHHHHHHQHNRTHIDIHSHHNRLDGGIRTTTTTQEPHHYHHHHHHHHHRPASNGVYPHVIKNEATSTPTSTTTTKHITQSPRHHHNHHYHHEHTKSTTTTSTMTPIPSTEYTPETITVKDNDLEEVEDLNAGIEISAIDDYMDEDDFTTAVTTTTTMQQNRQRQPEPTEPPLVSEEFSKSKPADSCIKDPFKLRHEFTLVTGLINIGRGDWFQYRRPLEKYHEFMENVLSLKNYMVVFTDDSSYDFAHKYRKNLGLMHMTKIHKISIEELPLYGYINEAKGIIKEELSNDTFYKLFADSDMKTHPEAKSAEYNIVVNSKTHFLHNVTMDNPFQTEHFIWLDAGYGHGNQSVFPYNNVWRPKFPDGKISLIKLTPEYDKLNGYSLKNLYRKNWAVLSGGFIAGDAHSIGQLHSIIHRKFIQLIYQKFVDDDQTLLVLAVNSYPHLFNIVHGDWFDAFRLFSVDAEIQLG